MTDLFDANQEDHQVPNDVNHLELLVGEGKKFKSVEELAKGKAESDAFIERLKQETDNLRKELLAAKRLEELVDKLGQKTNPTTPPNEDQPNHDGNEGGKGNAITPEQLEDLVSKTLSKREQENRHKSNVEEVKRTLTQTWGGNFAQKLAETAQALDMSREQLNQLAATNPKAFYKLVGVGVEQTKGNDLFTPPTSQVNTDSNFRPTTGNVRNKAYYDKLKRDNPSEYWKPSTQMQEYKDAMSMGDRFYS